MAAGLLRQIRANGVTEMVKLHAELSDGLESPRGKKFDFDLGNLNPGESRSVQVLCNAKGAGDWPRSRMPCPHPISRDR